MAKYTKIQPNETVDAIQMKWDGWLETEGTTVFRQRGNWIVDDDHEQYVLTDREFQQRFRRVEDNDERMTHIIYDPAKHEWKDGKLVPRTSGYHRCRKCGQVVE